jgi:hypothetical protein
MPRQQTCTNCGTPFTPTGPRQRRCTTCRPTGRDDRSPTTRAQTPEYQRNRRIILAGNPPCALRIHCNGAPATTADHITPVAHGGTNAISNMQPSCARCNAAKQDNAAPNAHAAATQPTSRHTRLV